MAYIPGQKVPSGQTAPAESRGPGALWDSGGTTYQWTGSAWNPIRSSGGGGEPSAIDVGKILETQKVEEEGLFKQFETARAGQEKLPTLYERLSGEMKVPELSAQLQTARGEVSKVKDLLDRLEEDINVRTSGFLVSEAQRRRSLAAEEAPLRTQLGRLLTGQEVAAGQLATAQTGATQKFQLTTAEQERELEPVRMRISAFSDRAAREITAYTNAKQQELSILLKKMEEEGALSRLEMTKASELSKQERTYQLEFEKINKQMEANVQEKLRTKSVTGGGTGLTFESAFGTGQTGGYGQSDIEKWSKVWEGETQAISPSAFGGFSNFSENFLKNASF